MSSRQSIDDLYKQQDFYIGLSLALSSSFFIGASFIIKKVGLIRLSRIGSVRASAGGFGYLKDWIWWAGLICMGIGEAANFAAYAFAPASLVTPLGALSVIVTAVLASKFLKERLNLLGKLGCFLCIIGSTIIVIHSPKEAEIEDLNLLLDKLQDPAFITYVGIILSLSLFIGCCCGPRYGHKNVIVYILLCSAIGSLTVMSCKALGLALRDTLSGKSNDFGMWLPYFLIVVTAVFVGIQVNYLNKALDIFNTSIVTPIYYVIFTTLVITASAILFKEWGRMKAEDILGDLCGFFVVIIAVILLNAFREMDISLNDVRGIMRPKRELLSHKNQYDEFLIETENNSLSQKQYGSGDYRDI
ncbi:magnesium transporter NIPA2 [Wyeomyia smithii]|uniref:magnesium transporter NIPA2 n=1 Tax=Wyeomyia smithii TaxID=174621 RepID=UPI0024680271|nr:magnesium transporter NIPA2 [Wyeomyia smithii]XP_055541107.1 magnesium transporter NIPA2 [Wyeomyia smithii]